MVLEPDPEVAVAYGIFSVRQAHNAGFSRAEVERRVRRGRWQRLGHGVLAEAQRQERGTDSLVLALLRAGPRSRLSPSLAPRTFTAGTTATGFPRRSS